MRQVSASPTTKALALILEGPIKLEPDFVFKVYELVKTEAPCEWEVISLKSRCPYGICVSPHLARIFPDDLVTNSDFGASDRCRSSTSSGLFAMLYRTTSLDKVITKLGEAVWDQLTPHCLEVDAALADVSNKISYYAVPYVQAPGFLTEGDSQVGLHFQSTTLGSLNWHTFTTTTSTTATTTSSSFAATNTTTTSAPEVPDLVPDAAPLPVAIPGAGGTTTTTITSTSTTNRSALAPPAHSGRPLPCGLSWSAASAGHDYSDFDCFKTSSNP
jgi:hypothetical protein